MTDQQEKLLKRIDHKLTQLLNREEVHKEATWVSVRFIQDLTGWNGTKLFEVRKQGIVQHRKNKAGGYEYMLESIPEQFLIKNKSNSDE